MTVIYPEATYEQIRSKPPMTAHDIICLHTMAGSLSGTETTFRRGGFESHFGIGHDGEILQWQDLDLVAESNAGGNHHLISIETADTGLGFPPWEGSDVPAWTSAQVEAIARLVAWLCNRFDIPCELIPDSRPGRRGVGFHRQGIPGDFPENNGLVAGGEVWTRLPQNKGKVCPGNRRIAQLPSVIERARRLIHLIPEAMRLRYVNLTNDEGSTATRSAILTVDSVGKSIVLPPGGRAWLQWGAFFPFGGENKIAKVDWIVITFPRPQAAQSLDPFDLPHRASGAMELPAGATAVELRVTGIPQGGAVGFHIDCVNHA